MEPGVIIVGGLAVLTSKELLNKVLGPTADYVGGEVKNFVAKCNVNLDKIFQVAITKLGKRLDEEGSVNPRVLKHIMDEGRFCEDDLTAEYYGGILASSKSRIGRDDRGVTMLALIKDLSVYQLRFHFTVYVLLHRLFRGSGLNIRHGNQCARMKFFIPISQFFAAMGFVEGESPDAVLSHCLFGLAKHALIADHFASGSTGHLTTNGHGAITEPGIIVTPTLPGAELFLWGIGLPGASGGEILDVEISGSLSEIMIPDGASSYAALEQKQQQARLDAAKENKMVN